MVKAGVSKEHKLEGAHHVVLPGRRVRERTAGEGVSLFNGLSNSSKIHRQSLLGNSRVGEDGCEDLQVHGGDEDHPNSPDCVSRGDQIERHSFSSQVPTRDRGNSPCISPLVRGSELSSLDRPVCDSILQQDISLFFEDARFSGSRNQRISSLLDERESVCLSPSQVDPSNTHQNSTGGNGCNDSSSGSSPRTMVPPNQESVLNLFEVPRRRSGRLLSRAAPRFALEDLSDPWSEQGVTGLQGDAQKVLNNSNKDAHKKALGVALRKFRSFVEQLDSEGCFSINDIINFLGQTVCHHPSEFEKSRTAISTALSLNCGFELTNDPLYSRFAKGASRYRPKAAKYDEMWDLGILLDAIKKGVWTSKERIGARTKALILLRISVAGRNRDLAHIHRESIVWSEDSVKFRLYEWKTQSSETTRFSRWMYISKLRDSLANICPYRALKKYMDLHQSDYERLKPQGIWLTYHGSSSVSHGTLAANTHKFMKEAGIPPKYGAATIRHATITFWRDMRISVEEVMNRTGHRSERIVLFYYDKSSQKRDITAEILHGEESDEEFSCPDQEG